MNPPQAKAVPHEITVHGDTRVDNYFWLRDRSDPEVTRYLEAENAHTESVMNPATALRETLYKEILGRIQETDLSVPVRRDDYYYYTRTEQGKQYAIYCRKKALLDAAEELLLDANLLAAGHSYFQLGNFSVSPDHRLLAYSTDMTGDEAFKIEVKDLDTGELLTDAIPNTYYGLEWAADNKTFFYVTLDAARRPYKVFRHHLGIATDALVYHEEDARFNLGIAKTKSRAFLMIDISSAITTEVRLLRADDPAGAFDVVLPRRNDIEYGISHHDNRLFITINDIARTFRLVQAPLDNPADQSKWREIIAARPDVTLEGTEAFRDHLLIVERQNGLNKFRIRRFSDDAEHYVEFPESVYSAGPTGNVEFKTNILRFTYTSLVTPPSVFDYNMDTRERELKKQMPVLGGYDSSHYETQRIYATAPDGVQVPISLVYKKELVHRDGGAPLLMYGYGAYGHSSEPGFSSDRLSLLDRGFVFAIAHVRGGGDLGKPWHDAGKLLNKCNTFTDFVACAECLIAQNYTSRDRFAIIGGSAGGLLMGAVANMRPDLFKTVVAKVPFVDVLNTMLDPTLPLTVSEFEEWGNPEDKQYYEYICDYSPYDKVAAREYPTMLVTAGLNDPRVSYWEPAKWVAKLRALKTDTNVLLLKTNMGSGHFGASGRYERIKETAFDYAFILTATTPAEP